MKARFTLDGDGRLERRLEEICQSVASGIQALVPAKRLEAIVLGGGYGRGEGGVQHTPAGDALYNDLEFYVFLRGNRLLNEREFREPLAHLAEDLSPGAGLHIEFKVESMARLWRGPVSMFSYDLVSGHRIVYGSAGLFAGCAHHLDARNIPASEATRLLFNRCTGLLLAREMLGAEPFGAAEADFAHRNLAKARLALGDALLAAHGRYHWSCRERHGRLPELGNRLGGLPVNFEQLQAHHAAGVAFKLHPAQTLPDRPELLLAHAEVAELGRRLWLWLESRRLSCGFASVRDYAFHPARKCPEFPGWRNFCLNLRTFGPRAVFDGMSARYPRERLLNALPLLLWDTPGAPCPECRRKLQKTLHTSATEWQGFVEAYKHVWPNYG